jgi:hypothetical protein
MHPMLKKAIKKTLKKVLQIIDAMIYPNQAQQLNRELYEAVFAIPPSELKDFRQKMIQFCAARGYSQQYTEDWMCHIYRLLLSLKELDAIIPDNKDFTVLEMGSEGVVSDLLKSRFPGAKFLNTTSDLRRRWDFPDEFADLIVSMEVVEHLTDPEAGEYLDGFYKSGLKSTLQEAFRVLKKGGKSFITTPNAASIYCLEKILDGNSAWYYPLHVREYTLDEMTAEVKEANFQIEKAAAVHCMTAPIGVNYAPTFTLLAKHGWPTKNRGDDIFITAVKP